MNLYQTAVSADLTTVPQDIGSVGILTTKLNRPPLGDDFVWRERLLKQLERSSHYNLILIAAPAGYGKSVLASQWLESCSDPNIWLSLDEDDNTLEGFIRYVVEAVERLFPQACRGTRSLLESSSPAASVVLVRTLIREVEAIPTPFILALDDYHYINDPAIHDLIAKLLRYPTSSLTLAIITRWDPPLPLSILRAGKMLEVRLQDLQFTPSETLTFLERTTGYKIKEEELAHLADQLEGWVGGLCLLSLSLPRQEDPEQFLISLRTRHIISIQDYLVEEVLVKQPAYLRECLKQTSILNRFCAPLLEVVCSPLSNESTRLDGSELMGDLNRGNLFVIALTGQGDWFRYHHLFQELLQRRLRRDYSPGAIATLHERASVWFESQKLIEEAIHHALLAEDLTGAAQIIERHRIDELNADRWYQLEAWLQYLPPDFRKQNPYVLISWAWILYYRYRLSEIHDVLKQIKSIIEDDQIADSLQAEIDLFSGILLYFQGKPEASLSLLEKGLEKLSKSAFQIRSEGELYVCLSLYSSGRKQEAFSYINQLIRELGPKDFTVSARYWGGLVFIQTFSGYLNDAAESAKRLEEAGRADHNPYAEAWGIYLQGLAYLQTNNLEKARPFFEAAVERRYALHVRAAMDAMLGLSMIHQLLDQIHEASSSLDMLIQFAWESQDSEMMSVARSSQARLALFRGDLYQAARWESCFSKPHPSYATMMFFLEIPAITQVRVLIAIGSKDSLEKAMAVLSNLWQGTEAIHNYLRMVEIGILQSVALEKLGNRSASLAVLETVVKLAELGSIIQPFVEVGDPMADLLGALHMEEPLSYFIHHVLDVLKPSSPSLIGCVQNQADPPVDNSGSTVQELVVLLTQRESEILEMIERRLQAKEIAQHLYISTPTVKSHLRNIYEKLGVHSRQEAIRRARDLGLLL